MAEIGVRWDRGVVRFDSTEAFEQEIALYLCKGAVRVCGVGLPLPLLPFQFRLVPPGGAEVVLRGMVVSQADGVALIQLVEFSEADLARIRQGAASATSPARAPPSPVSTAAPAPAPASPPAALTVTPGARSGRSTVSPASSGARSGRSTVAPASPGSPVSPGARSGRSTVAPASPGSPVSPGSRSARPTSSPSPAPASVVTPGAPPSKPLASPGQPGPSGHASSSFDAPGADPEVAPPAAAATPESAVASVLEQRSRRSRQTTGVFYPEPSTASGPLRGALVNPSGVDGLLSLPLGSRAVVQDVDRVSTVGLLRLLGARRVTGELRLVSEAGREQRFSLDRGSYLLTSKEREQLSECFEWSTGTYAFTPADPAHSPQRAPVSAWRLVLEAVKLLVHEFRQDEMAARLPSDRAVRLTGAFAERAHALNLSPTEERTTRRAFDGCTTLREMHKTCGVSETSVQRLVLLLLALGLCELVEPERVTAVMEDPVRAEYDRLAAADPFTALGLHWSVAPDRIDGALAAVRERYGPGTEAASGSPAYAAQLVELAERAHRQLGSRAARRAVRAHLGVDVRHSAQLLVQQVPLERSRGELSRVHELLSAACDLADDAGWERMLAQLGPRTR